MEFSKRLGELRRERGLSQDALAKKIGVTRQALGKWERGEAEPDLSRLGTVAAALGVTVEELFGAERQEASDASRETAPAEAPAPVEEPSPTEEPLPVEEPSPTEELSPIEEPSPVEEPTPLVESEPCDEPLPDGTPAAEDVTVLPEDDTVCEPEETPAIDPALPTESEEPESEAPADEPIPADDADTTAPEESNAAEDVEEKPTLRAAAGITFTDRNYRVTILDGVCHVDVIQTEEEKAAESEAERVAAAILAEQQKREETARREAARQRDAARRQEQKRRRFTVFSFVLLLVLTVAMAAVGYTTGLLPYLAPIPPAFALLALAVLASKK